MCLLAGAVLVVVYGALFAVRVTTGYAAIEGSPDYVVRLQVVDASGDAVGVREMRKTLDGWTDGVLAVDIVETIPFDGHVVGESFVVSRQENLRAATMLAERVGVDESAVSFRPLADNRRMITSTLVVGEDFGKTIVASLAPEEQE